MLEIKIAVNDPQIMAQDGSSILRSLQNKSLPLVDLIVRESIQNSLDATLEESDTTKVDIKVDKFDTLTCSNHFQGIENELKEKYLNNNYFLSIRDSNTSGLSGKVIGESIAELNDSNFFKLVFALGKNQEKAGSGGSWGLGKTSYFRIGNGIVIYYTRVKSETGYEERLIASLIEDNKEEDRLLKNSDRGIAWWGKINNEDVILPITNSDEISEILSIFKIRQYVGTETGTTVIIPYLSNEFIHRESTKNQIEKSCFWLNDLSEEIKIAVQRWYFPRLNNDTYRLHFNQSKLICSINDSLEINYFPEVTFKLLQNIYNSALLGNTIDENTINVYPIRLPRKGAVDVNKPIGHIAFMEVSKEDAKMLPPDNLQSPLAYLGNYDEKQNTEYKSKFLCYCRKPGMIIEYDFTDNWLPNGNIQKENHLLFSVFVPNYDLELSQTTYKTYPNVENYLRSIENADHAKWEDEHGYTFVKRTKSYIIDTVKKHFDNDENSTVGAATNRLSKILGNALLPPTGFGKRSSRVVTGNSNINRNSSSKASISVEDVSFVDFKTVKVLVKGRIIKNRKTKIKILVETQEGKIDKDRWESDLNTIDFPFIITSAKFINDNFKLQEDYIVEGNCILINELSIDKNIEVEILINKSTNQYSPVISITS